MLGACGMQKCHQEMLRKNRVSLASQLVLKELMEHLIEKDIITETMMEMIQAKSGNFSQNIEFLNLLPKRGPKAFSAFCEALRETKQQHLEEMLLSIIPCHRTEAVKRLHCYDQSFPFPVPESCVSQKRLYQNNAVPMEHSLDDGDGPHYSLVKPCTLEFYRTHAHLAYKLKSHPRGLALILSNVHFSNETDLELRSGGKVDNAALDTLFKHLGYQVVVKHDQTAQEMKEQLENFSKHPVHQNVDSCIVSLLSHGIEGGVYGVDGKLLQLQEIFSLFDNANCPNLQNKPKMFFIQACRGAKFQILGEYRCYSLMCKTRIELVFYYCARAADTLFKHTAAASILQLPLRGVHLSTSCCFLPNETDRGVDQIDGNDRASSPGCEESDANKKENPKLRLPTCSDMICGYACLKGTAAMRNTKRGSWYIEALMSVFAEDARNTHVADMLVKVNRLIKHREGHAPGTDFHRCKEMSEYCSTLCQDLYLFPGIVAEN